jgi:hypothetical protein
VTIEPIKIQKTFFTLAQSWSRCMTSLSYGLVFDLATSHDAIVPLLYLPKTPHKALLDGRIKGKAFSEERHTLMSDREYHSRNCILNFKTIKNLRIDGQLKNKWKARPVKLFCLATTQDLEEANKPHKWQENKGRTKCQYIQITKENFVIDMASLECKQHSSNSWSTTKILSFCSRTSKG